MRNVCIARAGNIASGYYDICLLQIGEVATSVGWK
jgi:hypothetical protein